MKDNELLNIWKSYDQKLEQTLKLDKAIAFEVTKNKLNRTISSMRLPKSILILFGLLYTFILCFITWITYQAGALIMMFGFGMISLTMIMTIIGYIYHLFLISKINHSDEIFEIQRKISELKISSYNIALLAIAQLPFWSVCWVSIEGVKNSPFIYGGINLLVFLILSYISYWLCQDLGFNKTDSKIGKIIFSGNEWEPIMKSSDILEQLKEYENL